MFVITDTNREIQTQGKDVNQPSPWKRVSKMPAAADPCCFNLSSVLTADEPNMSVLSFTNVDCYVTGQSLAGA